jgi:hypothetical protein
VRADLLAVAEQDVEDRLRGAHFSGAHRRVAVWSNRVRATALEVSGSEAPGIDLHYGVEQDQSRRISPKCRSGMALVSVLMR